MSKKQVISVVGNYTVVPKDELSGIAYAMNATISDIQSLLKELYPSEVLIIKNPFDISNAKSSPFIEFRMVNKKIDKSFALEFDAKGNVFYVFSYGKIKIAKITDSNFNSSDAASKLVNYNFIKDGNYYFAQNDFQGKLFPLSANATNVHESDSLDAVRAEGLGYLLKAARHQAFDVLPSDGLILPLNLEEATNLHYHIYTKNDTSNSTLPYIIAAAATAAGLYAINKMGPGGGDAPALDDQGGPGDDHGGGGNGGNGHGGPGDGYGGGGNGDNGYGGPGGGGNGGGGDNGDGPGSDEGSNGSGGGSQASRKSRLQREVDLKNILYTPRRTRGNENREEQELESTEVLVAAEDQMEESNLEFGEIYENKDEYVALADQVDGSAATVDVIAEVREQRAGSTDSMPSLDLVYGESGQENIENPMLRNVESDDDQEGSTASEASYLNHINSVDYEDLRDQNPDENLRNEFHAEVSDDESTSSDNVQHNASNIPTLIAAAAGVALVTTASSGGGDDGDAGSGANNPRSANNHAGVSNVRASAQSQDIDRSGDGSSDGGNSEQVHSDSTHNLRTASGEDVVDSSYNSMGVSGHSISGVNVHSHAAGEELKFANLEEEPNERSWNEWIANKAIPAAIGAAVVAGGALVYRMSVAGKNVDANRADKIPANVLSSSNAVVPGSSSVVKEGFREIATSPIGADLRGMPEIPDGRPLTATKDRKVGKQAPNVYVTRFSHFDSHEREVPTEVSIVPMSKYDADVTKLTPSGEPTVKGKGIKRKPGDMGNNPQIDEPNKRPNLSSEDQPLGTNMDVVENESASAIHTNDAELSNNPAMDVVEYHEITPGTAMDEEEHSEKQQDDSAMYMVEHQEISSGTTMDEEEYSEKEQDDTAMNVVEHQEIALTTRRVVGFAEDEVFSPGGDGDINDAVDTSMDEDESNVGSPAIDPVRGTLFATPARSTAAASSLARVPQTPGYSRVLEENVRTVLATPAKSGKFLDKAVTRFCHEKLVSARYSKSAIATFKSSLINTCKENFPEGVASSDAFYDDVLVKVWHEKSTLNRDPVTKGKGANQFGNYFEQYRDADDKETALNNIAKKFKLPVEEVKEIFTKKNLHTSYLNYLAKVFKVAIGVAAAQAMDVAHSQELGGLLSDNLDINDECALDTYQSILEEFSKEEQEELCELEDNLQEIDNLSDESFVKSQEEVTFTQEPTLAELIAGNSGLYAETAAHSLASVGLSIVAPNYFKSAAVYAYSKLASDMKFESEINSEGRNWGEWAETLPEQIVNSISSIEPKDFAKYSFDSWISFGTIKPITEIGFLGLSTAASLISNMVLPKHVSETQMVPFASNAKFVYLGGAYAGSMMLETSKAVVSYVASGLMMPSVAKASDNMLKFFSYQMNEVSFSLSEAMNSLYIEAAEKYDHAKDYFANVFEIRVEDASNCYVFKTSNSTNAEYQSDNYDAPIGETLFHSYSA